MLFRRAQILGELRAVVDDDLRALRETTELVDVLADRALSDRALVGAEADAGLDVVVLAVSSVLSSTIDTVKLVSTVTLMWPG